MVEKNKKEKSKKNKIDEMIEKKKQQLKERNERECCSEKETSDSFKDF